MRLTVDNFFSRLIFLPLEADTKKEAVIAFVASIACGIFSFGMCYVVCAIRNYFVYRPPSEATEQDRRIAEAKKSALKTQVLVRIDSAVKVTLDQLLQKSPYSIATLPVYEFADPLPKRERMKNPMMKGMAHGLPFIIIKVECTLTDKNLETTRYYLNKTKRNYYKKNRKVEGIVILYQHKPFELIWSQYHHESSTIYPEFFQGSFTDKSGSGPTDSEKGNFKLVQELLEKSKGPDTNGLIWSISQENMIL